MTLGCECVLEPYVFIKRWTTMGDRNQISAGTVLGTDPLDKNFTGERSYLRIGNDNKIREHYTISRGTQPESVTVIGDSNYIMTSGHIAHNAVIGNHTLSRVVRSWQDMSRSAIRRSSLGAWSFTSFPGSERLQ